MKPITPPDFQHDAFDDLIVAALHGELPPEERTAFDTRIAHDPAARAAYYEAKTMHDLLEKTHTTAQPDPDFEQRMLSGVRRKLHTEPPHETAWESVVALWTWVKSPVMSRGPQTPLWRYGRLGIALFAIAAVLAGVALGPVTNGIKQSSANAERRFSKIYHAQEERDGDQRVADSPAYTDGNRDKKAETDLADFTATRITPPPAGTTRNGLDERTPPTSIAFGSVFPTPIFAVQMPIASPSPAPSLLAQDSQFRSGEFNVQAMKLAQAKDKASRNDNSILTATPASVAVPGQAQAQQAAASSESEPVAVDARKLIRDAQLDLEVKSFQAAADQIEALTKGAGGYVDTSNSQRGGNGKLQGTIVVKVLPQNLDGFLLKLWELGNLTNQSVSTNDVTKEYFDTQARLENSRRMETQLQDLLKRENGKVSDLLAVERELGRVRGEIEQMQGQLKLYDFQVQYATVTMQLHEKDLNQAAAYLLKEQDDFSLFATDVEGTFQQARHTAEDFKAQVLTANLNHNSGSDVSAELVVTVAPDQIEAFLSQVRGLGRVANFTRQTQRVAKDGGDSDQPADQTLTEKDKVQVHLAIRSDDESRKQVALTVVTKAVDTALDQAKAAALANAGVEILSSALNKSPQGQSTAQLSVRVPGKEYDALMASFKGLGRTASLSIQRNDNSGPGANGDDAPVIVSLSLSDDDTPLQETALNVMSTDVDGGSQRIKKDAAAAGAEVKASSFERQPDGTELAQLTFRLPMAKYPAFLESVKALGKVESLTVHRDDRPDQTVTDDTAPVEITLQLHNQRDVVADNSGLFVTLRETFGEGASALFGSVRVIGVLIAFALPWVVVLVFAAWVGRRIYVSRKK